MVDTAAINVTVLDSDGTAEADADWEADTDATVTLTSTAGDCDDTAVALEEDEATGVIDRACAAVADIVVVSVWLPLTLCELVGDQVLDALAHAESVTVGVNDSVPEMDKVRERVGEKLAVEVGLPVTDRVKLRLGLRLEVLDLLPDVVDESENVGDTVPVSDDDGVPLSEPLDDAVELGLVLGLGWAEHEVPAAPGTQDDDGDTVGLAVGVGGGTAHDALPGDEYCPGGHVPLQLALPMAATAPYKPAEQFVQTAAPCRLYCPAAFFV